MHQYQLDASALDIGDHFRASIGNDIWEEGTVNALSPAPVIIARPDGRRMLRPFFWGYPPPNGGDAAVLTVRNLESPFWIGNLRHIRLRCLIPATSFTLRAKGKTMECGAVSGGLLAFAGIWKDTTDYPAFAIVTTDANRILADRGVFSMPVILDPIEQVQWLTQEWRQAQKLVEPYPSQLLKVG